MDRLLSWQPASRTKSGRAATSTRVDMPGIASILPNVSGVMEKIQCWMQAHVKLPKIISF